MDFFKEDSNPYEIYKDGLLELDKEHDKFVKDNSARMSDMKCPNTFKYDFGHFPMLLNQCREIALKDFDIILTEVSEGEANNLLISNGIFLEDTIEFFYKASVEVMRYYVLENKYRGNYWSSLYIKYREALFNQLELLKNYYE